MITILVIDFSLFFPLPLSFFEIWVYPLLLQKNCLSRSQSDLRAFLKLPTLGVPASDAVTCCPPAPLPWAFHLPFCLPLTLSLPVSKPSFPAFAHPPTC